MSLRTLVARQQLTMWLFRFHVDEYSELYYNPAPLLEYQKEGRPSANGEEQSSTNTAAPPQVVDFPSTPQMHRTNSHLSPNPAQSLQQQYYNTPGPGSMASPRNPYPGGHSQVAGYNGMSPVSPNQFYGGPGGGDGMSVSPMRMGMNPGMNMAGGMGGGMGSGMGGMGMGGGMGVGMGGMGMAGGMGGGMGGGMAMGMGMGIHGGPDAMGMGSPEVRRRMGRMDDGFGMHG